MNKIVFFDFEVDSNRKIGDIGAVRSDGAEFHSSSVSQFTDFISDCDFLCGHNIVDHDYTYLRPFLDRNIKLIDTLYLSPLLFPERPYHNLVKDDKLLTEQLNNPLNDSLKARTLFMDEKAAFDALPENMKRIYYSLLGTDSHFSGFFSYAGFVPDVFSRIFRSTSSEIAESFRGRICSNVDLAKIIRNTPVGLAYALSLITTDDKYSVTPPWVLYHYPETAGIIHKLRNVNCYDSRCEYCSNYLDARKALKNFFGYDSFRQYEGESLQEDAVNAAIAGESILAVFPTGGGKSLTFQLPALVGGYSSRELTVVISPLQSLMKDQVENLEKKNISDAVYINGLLSPIERAKMMDKVRSGEASILYIAPELLRSKTMERILLSRTISRFVIDEAHCFSSWGQDFRIEYMYIGEFIKNLQAAKGLSSPIPVSCFTATAKPKVISDIMDYFSKENGLSLKKFTTSATRTNLRYTVLYMDSIKEKYATLRNLIQERNCPSIVYVSRTASAEKIAGNLQNDGFNAKAFHGQMDTMDKIRNQDDFISGTVQIIVATSAFGMGVDKSDVGLVVHYEISDSLENYLQEAGRAGRDLNTEADCFVLYNDDDLNKHFVLLNQTKLTFSEINQVWRAVKALTQNRNTIQISPLEVARKAGWEDARDVENKVKSALAALENAGYLKRGMNSPRIFATSIIPKSYTDAEAIIDRRNDFTDEEKVTSKRIIKSLISGRSRAVAGTSDAESRIDYISDMLGIETRKVICSVENMRRAGLLASDNDMTAFLRRKRISELEYFARIESFLLGTLNDSEQVIDLKLINESIVEAGVKKSKIKDLRTILLFWTLQDYIGRNLRTADNDCIRISQNKKAEELLKRQELRISVCRYVLSEMTAMEDLSPGKEYSTVVFSVVSLLEGYNSSDTLYGMDAGIEDIQEALLFLSKTGIITLEGGFMVIYNKLSIERRSDNQRYKKDDYRTLDEFYRQKIQQIHIVGEFANMIVRDYLKAMQYVNDYFTMDFKAFVRKYFDSTRQKEISMNVSPRKYQEIFGCLTTTQKKIISDRESKYIVVSAGPGSGKTFVLVRKLASLILMEDIKSEQLLMLTFSRASATEFRKRLSELIGNAAKYVEIKTFHSYCFDVLGQRGTLEKSDDVVAEAVNEIILNRVETSRVTKSILVIDEAQDMSANEFALVEALIRKNDDLRVIAVGDDDQNIYAFRGSDSKYLKSLITDQRYQATRYDMLENFRSCREVIDFANAFIKTVPERMKFAPVIPTRTDKGEVTFVRHTSDCYEQAIVNDIMSREIEGTMCVLTWTNRDALIISALLNRYGKKARLIQSLDGVSLACIREFRWFIEHVGGGRVSVIPKQQWEEARKELSAEFSRSATLGMVHRCLDIFESEYNTLYFTDFENFLQESNAEDFTESKGEEVIVSTIHKAKGNEYDNVFISLKDLKDMKDEERRALYVGFTRARNMLVVHSKYDFSRIISSPEYVFRTDYDTYGEPSEVLMQMSYKDVVLNFFIGRDDIIGRLYSGDILVPEGEYLCADLDGRLVRVVKFAERFRAKVAALEENGYRTCSARVRYAVYWKHEFTPGNSGSEIIETLILLPDISFRKVHISVQ